jgi:hypothetical protein
MLAFLKRLLWDESAFARYARLVLLTGGAGLSAAAITWTLPAFMFMLIDRETWLFVAAAMQGLGGLIPAGEMNKTLPELRKEERVATATALVDEKK